MRKKRSAAILATVKKAREARTDNVVDLPLKISFEHRFPWLFLGLLGGILAAKIVGVFEATLEKNLTLAAFIPLIVYMSDAVGTQMEAFVIRDLAIRDDFNFGRYLRRQLRVLFLIALVISLGVLVLSWLLYQDWGVSKVLAIALFFSVISAVFTGLLIPYFFSAFRLDPANASGPIATVIQDILSVVIYFSVASWLL
jgi:magnesium transporter